MVRVCPLSASPCAAAGAQRMVPPAFLEFGFLVRQAGPFIPLSRWRQCVGSHKTNIVDDWSDLSANVAGPLRVSL